MNEEFGESWIDEFGMEVGKIVWFGVSDGVATDAVSVVEETIIESRFGIGRRWKFRFFFFLSAGLFGYSGVFDKSS